MKIKVVNISKNKKYAKKNFKNKSELYIYCDVVRDFLDSHFNPRLF